MVTSRLTSIYLFLVLYVFWRVPFTYSSKPNVTIGVIFDETAKSFDQFTYATLKSMESRLTHAIYVSKATSNPDDVPYIHFEVAMFSYSAVCELLDKGAQVIISVGSCMSAELITSVTEPLAVPYLPILRDGCVLPQHVNTTGKPPIKYRYALGASDQLLANALEELLELEHVINAVLLTGGPSCTLIKMLQYTETTPGVGLKNMRFAIQPYRTFEQTGPEYSRIPFLENMLRRWHANFTENLANQRQEHFVIFDPYNIYLDEIYTIMITSSFAEGAFWILGSPPNVSPEDIVKWTDIPQIDGNEDPVFVNFAFFRTFPILSYTDCIYNPRSDNVRIFASAMFRCNVQTIPEPIVLVTYLAFLVGRGVIALNHNHSREWLENTSRCNVQTPVEIAHIRSGLVTFIGSDPDLDEMNNALWLYSSKFHFETRTTSVVATVKFANGASPTITLEGRAALMNSHFSPVFRNRFDGLHNQTIRVGVLVDDLFIKNSSVLIGNELFNASGLAVDILDDMSQHFNFNYRLFVPKDGQYGLKSDDGNWTGLIGELLEERIDMAVALLTVTESRSKDVDFLGPFLRTYLTTMIVKPKYGVRLFQIYKPFSVGTWLLTGACIVAVAFCAYLFNRFSPYSAWNQGRPDATSDEISYRENLWILSRSMFQQPIVTFPVASSTRALVLMFWFFVLIWYACWQATMTAFFSNDELLIPVHTLRDIAQQNLIRPIVLNGSSVYAVFQNAKDDPVYERIYQMIREDDLPIDTYQDAKEALYIYSKFAFIDDYYLLRIIASSDCGKFYLLNELLDETPASFAVRKESHYTQVFTYYFMALSQSGVIDRLLHKWLPDRNICYKMNRDYDPLDLDTTGGGFLPMLCCICLTGIALVLEFFWVQYGSQIKQSCRRNVHKMHMGPHKTMEEDQP